MVHWPEDPPVQMRRFLDQRRGDVCTVSQISMSVHTGTHMDAPLHFIAHGQSIDQVPFDATVGPARVIAISDRQSIKVDELRKHRWGKKERILFKTRNSRVCWKRKGFDENFVYISKEAAEFLVEKKVQTVGVDYLSVGGYKRDGVETHQALLGAGIWVIEGLDLSRVKAGPCELICLPLKLLGADGAPARAIVRMR